MNTPKITLSEAKTSIRKAYEYLRPDGLNSEMLIPVAEKIQTVRFSNPREVIIAAIKPEGVGLKFDHFFG